MRVREKNFSELLTAGEKLIKLKLSIQDFLLLGPVRLLPNWRPGFFFSIVVFFGVFLHGTLRLAFRFRFLCAVGSFFVLGL